MCSLLLGDLMKDDNKTKKQLVHELTELRSQNAELKKSDSPVKYRSLVEDLRDVIYELDSQGVVLYISPAVRDLLGYDSTEIVGKNFIELAHKDDLSSRAEWFSELRKGVESPSEYRIIDKSGEYKWAQTRVRPIMEAGQFRGARGILIDVTEQRRTEEALRESEEKYRLSFENVADVIYMIDANLNVLSVSPSVERILGYKPQDFIGRSASDLAIIFTPESFEQAIADISLILKGDTIHAAIYQFIAKDGTIKHGEVSGSPVMRDGKIIGIISVARDITDRNLAEEALKESEGKYRDLYDFLPIPVYEMDFEANMTSVNRAIYKTFRGTKENFKKGVNAWQNLSPEEIDKSSKNIERLLRGENIEGSEYTLTRVDGSVFPALVISSLIYDKGKPVGLRGAIVDITERKKAEEKLRENEERYRALFDRSLDLVYITDFEGRFIDANDAALNRLGYNREEIRSLNFATLLSEDQMSLALQSTQEILDTGYQRNAIELRLKAKNGQDVFVETVGSVIKREGIPYAVQGIARDITDRKRAEEELQRTLESLRKSFGATIQAMVSAVESRDPYTAGHQIRSANLARCIATEMGLPKEKIEGIRMAGSIHDIGKLSIPAEILSKPTKLTNIEFSLIKEHSQKGYEMLKDVESPWPLAQIVYQHHERMDGSGYPRNLKGDDILVEARIMAVADVVESMASHRPYRPAIGIKAALEEIEKNKGILYDDAVADACLRLFRERGFQLEGA
jgi:PAS domain S-box-containing protein